jgi:hypothetical protein
MDISEACGDIGQENLEVFELAHIGRDRRHRVRPAWGHGNDLLLRRLQLLAGEIGEHHVETEGREQFRRGKADARSRAGDDSGVA